MQQTLKRIDMKTAPEYLANLDDPVIKQLKNISCKLLKEFVQKILSANERNDKVFSNL